MYKEAPPEGDIGRVVSVPFPGQRKVCFGQNVYVRWSDKNIIMIHLRDLAVARSK